MATGRPAAVVAGAARSALAAAAALAALAAGPVTALATLMAGRSRALGRIGLLEAIEGVPCRGRRFR